MRSTVDVRNREVQRGMPVAGQRLDPRICYLCKFLCSLQMLSCTCLAQVQRMGTDRLTKQSVPPVQHIKKHSAPPVQCHLAVGASGKHVLQSLQNCCLRCQARIRQLQFCHWGHGPTLPHRELQQCLPHHSSQALVEIIFNMEAKSAACEAGVVIVLGP